MSLVARILEEHGISTVIMGSAIDIVEYCGVPRYVFTDFPLGNPCGKPYDKVSQQGILDYALEMLELSKEPGITVRTPFIWNESADWKDNYMRVDDSNRAKLLKLGSQRREVQASGKTE